jgi:hypothetical protein
MREFFNRYGVAVVVVVLLIAGAVYWFYGRGAPEAEASGVKAFYIDEETGEESVRPVTDVPPLAGKGGKDTVVVAAKYSCDGGKTSQVGYLMKYTPEGKAALEEVYKAGKDESSININMMQQVLVRLPGKDGQWVFKQSDMGMRITDAGECPPGQRKTAVTPPK